MEPALLSAVREAWVLAACGYAGEPCLTIFKKQTRFAFAAAVHSKTALEWFHILQTPELSMYARLNPRLALKPLRVYMSHRWEIGQKIKIIKDTYTFIQLFGSPLQDALIRTEGVNLAQFVIANDYDAYVKLGYDNSYRKEGELVVSLLCAELGGTIISLVFSFEQLQNGEWAMYIGCIQGRHGVDNKPISKAMHGLWPKALIVYVAQEIACALGAKYIYGVGNAIHSHKKKHIIHIPSRHGLTFDYDSLWADVDGKMSAEGWFDIPLQLQRRPYEDMKSNKRSMYNRRYTMLDDISKQIRSFLLPSG
jgi:uncharacterized protein VirK/YbjX